MDLGLTGREADAYIALYSFEETTATQLAKITKEHRTNIYDSLAGLVKKGLITYIIRRNVQYYRVTDPEKLLNYLEEKATIARSIIPELKRKLHQATEKPTVEVYEGNEGFKSLLSLMLREEKTISVIGDSEHWAKELPIFTEQFVREREKRRIHAKILCTKGVNPVTSEVNEIRFMPSRLAQPSTIAVFGEYTAIFMYTKPQVATLTKSRELAQSFKEYFQVLWKTATPQK